MSETCCTNLGSVADRFSSISRRIRCSSSESGISPISRPGSGGPDSEPDPILWCSSIVAHPSGPLNASRGPGLPSAGYSPVPTLRHQDRIGPGPRRPNAPARPGAAPRPEASRCLRPRRRRGRDRGRACPGPPRPAPCPNGRPAPCPKRSVPNGLAGSVPGRRPGSRRTSCWAEMPSRRTPGPTSSDRSRSRATRPTSAARSVGAASVRERVTVVKSPKRTLSWTVRAAASRGPQARRHPVGQADELVLERGVVVEVDREGLLVADRLHLLVGDDRPLVAVPGQRVEVVTRGVAEGAHERVLGDARRGRRRSRRRARRAAFGRRADTPEAAYRQRVQHVELGTGLDHEETVGLGEVAGQLGEQLGGGDAHRDGEPGLGLHPGADGPCDVGPGAVEPADAGDVEERLVERDGFDQRRVRPQDLHDVGAHVVVEVEPGREEHAVRARATRPRHRRRRVDAEGARLVARGRHHAAPAESAHDHRSTDQARVVALFDRRVERVEVDVQDASRPRGGLTWCRCAPPGVRRGPCRTRRRRIRARSSGPQRCSIQSASGSRTHGAHSARNSRTRVGGRERGLDDDAVGIVDHEVTLEGERAVHLAPHHPPHLDRGGPHLVERALPLGDAQAGLLLHLASEPGPQATRRWRRSRRPACSSRWPRRAVGCAPAAGRRATPRAHRRR